MRKNKEKIEINETWIVFMIVLGLITFYLIVSNIL
jgi:hypothetical protein